MSAVPEVAAPDATSTAEVPDADVAAPDASPVASACGSSTPWPSMVSMADGAGNVTAQVEVPDGPLTFQQHMWDRFEFLWKRRVEPAELLLVQTAAMLRARAQVERQYAESLAGLQQHIRSEMDSASSVQGAVGTVVVNFKKRGEQSRELADQIEQDVAVTFEEVAEQHQDVCRRLHADMQALTRYCLDTRKAMSKLAARYGSRCAEAELAAKDVLQGLAMKSQERTKLAMRVATLSLQARAAEFEYYAGIEQANRAAVVYQQHLPHALKVMQDLEEQTELCLRDGLRKLAVYEMSWLKNMEYDLVATVKAAEVADPVADLQQFLKSNWMEMGRRAPAEAQPQFAIQAYYQLGSAKLPRETPERKQLRDDDNVVRQFIMELQPLVQKLVSETDASAAKEASPVAQLKQGYNDIRRRSALCQVLKAEVLSKEPPGTEIDNAKNFTIALIALEALGLVVLAALDGCDEHSDSWNGRDLMVIAQLFRAETDSGKPTSLLPRIYNHKIWSKVSFWEEVLLVGLCEAHAAEAIWRRSLPAGSQFVNPSMTTFLDRFVGHMLTFGIRLEQARSAVNSTLRKNAALLGAGAKAYETLLLQAYDAADASKAAMPSPTAPSPVAAPAGATSAPGASGHTAADLAKRPLVISAPTPSAEDADVVEEDDFESVALGLPVESKPKEKPGVEPLELQEEGHPRLSHADVFG